MLLIAIADRVLAVVSVEKLLGHIRSGQFREQISRCFCTFVRCDYCIAVTGLAPRQLVVLQPTDTAGGFRDTPGPILAIAWLFKISAVFGVFESLGCLFVSCVIAWSVLCRAKCSVMLVCLCTYVHAGDR